MFRPADQAVAAACVALTLAGCHEHGRDSDLPHAPPSLSGRFLAPRGWTWSTLKLKDGVPLRYGVASPPVTPHGNVLILPNHGEPGEVWFETVNDLLDRGYTVWLLEVDTKGGEALDPAQAALATMARDIVRPTARAPLVIVAQGLGATLTLATGPDNESKAALLASPVLAPAPGVGSGAAEWLSRIDLGWLPLAGARPPEPGRDDGLDPRRARLAEVWRRSDPSLKPARPSFGWAWAFDQVIGRAGVSRAAAAPHVVMAATVGDLRAAEACRRLPSCTTWAIPAAAPHLAPDALRKAWLDRIADLTEKP